MPIWQLITVTPVPRDSITSDLCGYQTHMCTCNFFKKPGVVGHIFDPSTMKAEADTEPILVYIVNFRTFRTKRSPPPRKIVMSQGSCFMLHLPTKGHSTSKQPQCLWQRTGLWTVETPGDMLPHNELGHNPKHTAVCRAKVLGCVTRVQEHRTMTTPSKQYMNQSVTFYWTLVLKT